jgi:glutamate-ammonia-ligase adenylyltransferase
LRTVSSQESWIKSKAESSLNPTQVGNALSEIASRWEGSLPEFLRDFPLGENALIHLLAVSSICAQRLQREPQLLRWLAQPEISTARRGPRSMAVELRGSSESVEDENFRDLRIWKAREMTRIALREIAGVAALEETTAELSQIAEICLNTVYRQADAQLRARYGNPATPFTVLGLGKLGGRELNHSSDVDLIFLYGEEGQVTSHLSNHEWHNRLAETILKAFSVSDPARRLFRVDLRLRPEGSAGPLTRSLESIENYYAGFGETWERLALIKARRVCGSEELAYEFLTQHQPFIFPKTPTPELLDEVAAIKRRIEREVPLDDINVKLGVGGIREIEFIVQTLQFIHGAHHAFLQEKGTIRTLQAIAQLGLLPRQEVLALDHSYRLFRRVEHRLQIEAEQQTHSLPADPVARERLARSLDFVSVEELIGELRNCAEGVRAIFTRLVAAGSSAPAINLAFFADQSRASRALNELAQGSATFHVAPRTRQIFRKLRPLLLQELSRCADPDATLTGIVRFVEAFGLRSLLFELLATNPKLLQLLVQTFDASAFATQQLIRHPQLLEEITRSAKLNRALSVSEHLAALREAMAQQDFDAIRVYRDSQWVRITIRDIMALSDLRTLFREHTALAEACLLAANYIVGAHDLTIVAMGKFGGRELTYGSDLDIMFVGEDYRGGQNLLSALSTPSGHGVIASVDVRLRPEGEKGPLVASLQAFETYYRDRAQLWEIQALTRARPIAGPHQASFRAIAHAAWAIVGRDMTLFQKIDAMLQRIRRDRGSGSDALDFKTGTGGIVEAEFLVQGLQMHYDIRESSTTRAIEKLVGAISRVDAEALTRAYEFLRRCESALRRWQNKSVSSLPQNSADQRKLAIRMGFKNEEGWRVEYEQAREHVHTIYRRYFAR